MATHSPDTPGLTPEECEAQGVPHWQRGLAHLRSHLAECEAEGKSVAWRESLPAALAEAQREGKPVYLQYSCFEHGRLGAPNL